jgi:mono/diheme cytochrome c family protein
MKITRSFVGLLCATVVLVITGTVAHGGGWATVTVNNLPEYFVAGKPVTLTFLVRAHGVTLVDGLKTAVSAKMDSEKEIQFATAPTGNLGEYKAVVTVPKPGEWTIRINSGWMDIPFHLVPMKAIADGSPAPAPISEIERGERLFVLRGCVGCHENKDVRSINITKIGPTLTGKRYPTDMLKAFLKDPSAGWNGKEAAIGEMPNLHLDPRDIDAIVAFLNRPRT